MDNKTYTTHQVSKFCGVYPTTVIKWIKDGLLGAYTTPGGHRRIKGEDILRLMKKNNMPIPEELEKEEKYKILAIDDDTKILKMISTVVMAENDLEIQVTDSGFDAGFNIVRYANAWN